MRRRRPREAVALSGTPQTISVRPRNGRCGERGFIVVCRHPQQCRLNLPHAQIQTRQRCACMRTEPDLGIPHIRIRRQDKACRPNRLFVRNASPRPARRPQRRPLDRHRKHPLYLRHRHQDPKPQGDGHRQGGRHKRVCKRRCGRGYNLYGQPLESDMVQGRNQRKHPRLRYRMHRDSYHKRLHPVARNAHRRDILHP